MQAEAERLQAKCTIKPNDMDNNGDVLQPDVPVPRSGGAEVCCPAGEKPLTKIMTTTTRKSHAQDGKRFATSAKNGTSRV